LVLPSRLVWPSILWKWNPFDSRASWIKSSILVQKLNITLEHISRIKQGYEFVTSPYLFMTVPVCEVWFGRRFLNRASILAEGRIGIRLGLWRPGLFVVLDSEAHFGHIDSSSTVLYLLWEEHFEQIECSQGGLEPLEAT
jgi:hypothetical protein